MNTKHGLRVREILINQGKTIGLFDWKILDWKCSEHLTQFIVEFKKTNLLVSVGKCATDDNSFLVAYVELNDDKSQASGDLVSLDKLFSFINGVLIKTTNKKEIIGHAVAQDMNVPNCGVRSFVI